MDSLLKHITNLNINAIKNIKINHKYIIRIANGQPDDRQQIVTIDGYDEYYGMYSYNYGLYWWGYCNKINIIKKI